MSKISGTFKRISPTSQKFNAIVPLGWVAVNFRWMPDKSERRREYGKWYTFVSEKGRVHRAIRFAANAKRNKAKNSGEIAIDWLGWIALNGYEENVDGPIEITIEKVPFYKVPFIFRTHPDPAYRLAAWVAWVSVALGIISFAPFDVIFNSTASEYEDILHYFNH